ncbi:hypothetical protein [Methylomarinum vadi]|uniref:hypothetical protein n=1 Tax=Methylomarinum vadi TaxID=438855 RepID=UPI0004DF9E79|nr:hypothetical protein [Methylomarinum vadi]
MFLPCRDNNISFAENIHMPCCPTCLHELARIENIKSYFRKRTCPYCGEYYKLDKNRFAMENFLLLLGWMIFYFFFGTEASVLQRTHWQLSLFETLALSFLVACLTINYVLVYFNGKLIPVESKPPRSERIEHFLTYEPMFSDRRFEWPWLKPVFFVIGLSVIAILLAVAATNIAS